MTDEQSSRRARTEARLIEAVGELIAEKGIHKLGVNAVARQAGVDKVLIYRYFGGLEGLYRAFGESGDFWPTLDELLGPDQEETLTLPNAEAAARVLGNLAKGLRARPLTLQLLALECASRNALTIELETVRERRGQEIAQAFAARGRSFGPELVLAISILAGSINYLLLRSRDIRWFGGTDLRDDKTWANLEPLITKMIAGLAH